jgi:hypothetical protein
MLRRQRHAAALDYANRKVEMLAKKLQDLKDMRSMLYEGASLEWTRPEAAMYNMVSELVDSVRKDKEDKERQIQWVLKLNKDYDEDEAWKTWWKVEDEELEACRRLGLEQGAE